MFSELPSLVGNRASSKRQCSSVLRSKPEAGVENFSLFFDRHQQRERE